MHDELKQQLDRSVPTHITLTELKKREILREAQNEAQAKRSFRLPKMMPALASAAVIGLSGLLGYPYAVENGWFAKSTLQAVVIPDHPYPVLINAEYADEKGALIYSDEQRIYSFAISTQTETVLAEAAKNAKIREIAFENEWVVWQEVVEKDGVGSSSLNILNQESGEIETIENVDVSALAIDGDMLSYLAIGVEFTIPAYKLLNLQTLEEPFEHVLVGVGSNSRPSFEEGLLVIPERVEKADMTETTFWVYQADDQSRIDEYTVPYEAAVNVTLTDGKIFAQLSNEENTISVLGYIDLATGKLVEIKTPEFLDYAVYGKYVALRIPKGETDTVKLFEIEGRGVKELQAFNSVKERLVKPRFSEAGTLLVNGEGATLSMYLQDTSDLD
ncbi:hypothetical protein [Planococcus sp. YIM B11945]|uniref:hypothetical protein n=1 Tax=Planococcus sp. YIM B11945 TaxID=3435410 RepID=UPI003D7E75B0